jgi:Mysoin-binding motif of peroxisomes
LLLQILMFAYSSNPLPPISRLEVTGIDRRCRILRSGVVNAINSTIHCYLEAHNVMLPLVDSVDMQRYHDIYELPRQDYQEMIQGLPSTATDDPESLGGLKMSMLRLFIARQILFCDLLALPSESSVPGTNRWTLISDEIASLSQVVSTSATSVGLLIDEEENRHWGDQSRGRSQDFVQGDESQGPEVVPPRTPAKEKVHAQFRRLDALSRSIRSLNARMLLMRDEANSLIEGAGHSTDITSVLAKQYDLVGSDLRNLMSEWERGRNTMLLGIGAIDRSSLSRSSSGLRSPHSPVHSLGGITAVNEGSPAEALRRLTEEGLKAPSNDGLGSDEEIFEAVALPPKPKRLSMTREEKLAKMQEDRRKRATLQESRDASTNMLRELETVIKHRPRGRTTSRITSV